MVKLESAAKINVGLNLRVANQEASGLSGLKDFM